MDWMTEPLQEELESHLDGETPLPDAESRYSRQLEALRRRRADFQSWITALEPSPEEASVVAGRIMRAARAHELRSRIWRAGRWAGAAAACVLAGFLLRGAFPHQGAGPTAGGPGVQIEPVSSYQVTLRDGAGRVVAVQRFDSLDKAQEFAADLAQYHSASTRLAGGQFVVHADRF